MTKLRELLSQLISFQSVTPHDAGCQKFMLQFLKELGFICHEMNQKTVSNFFACYGDTGPLLVFAGHTDVVPIGEMAKWNTAPFSLEEKEGLFYGRGVADMKGSLACMLLMAERFISSYPSFKGRLGFLITSGEEGDDFEYGTPYVMKELQHQGISIDYCIVGEPSSSNQVGDVIKIGRRGSLSAKIDIHGKQGHVAYPHLADNPIHKASPALAALTSTNWDKGNAHFPPTSMQITSLYSGGYAGNIIPGDLKFHLNFRFSTEQTPSSLQKKVLHIFHQHHLNPSIDWHLNGEPFLTDKGLLLESTKEAIMELTKKEVELSTNGGTSDGRFIAPYGVEVIELGPVNATIHQVNECVSVRDLELLEKMYFSICEKIFLM